MAIIRELKKVENNKLHDAILLTTLVDNNKYKFNKLYVDPDKECAIYFKDILPLKEKLYKLSSLILEIMLHHHQELKIKKSQPLKIMSIIMMITQQPSIQEMVGSIK